MRANKSRSSYRVVLFRHGGVLKRPNPDPRGILEPLGSSAELEEGVPPQEAADEGPPAIRGLRAEEDRALGPAVPRGGGGQGGREGGDPARDHEAHRYQERRNRTAAGPGGGGPSLRHGWGSLLSYLRRGDAGYIVERKKHTRKPPHDTRRCRAGSRAPVAVLRRARAEAEISVFIWFPTFLGERSHIIATTDFA